MAPAIPATTECCPLPLPFSLFLSLLLQFVIISHFLRPEGDTVVTVLELEEPVAILEPVRARRGWLTNCFIKSDNYLLSNCSCTAFKASDILLIEDSMEVTCVERDVWRERSDIITKIKFSLKSLLSLSLSSSQRKRLH